MVVEILLILPVFLLMVFSIMELGYIAFQTIVTHHAAYECARIGSLYAGAIKASEMEMSSPNRQRAEQRASEALRKMLRQARFRTFRPVRHGFSDPQTGRANYDLLVEVENRVRLIFPGSSYLFSQPKGTGIRPIRAVVRMPIENPLPATLR